MVLRRGDGGESIKTLQRGLNKLGSMLLVDGDFGAGTANAWSVHANVLAVPAVPRLTTTFNRRLAPFRIPFHR
jgi:hypothetical protein